MTRTPLIFTIIIMSASCSQQVKPVMNLYDDPMQHVFESIREDIQSLSNIGRLKVWQAGCAEHFEIRNDYDLNEAIKYFGEVPESEVGIIKSQLKNSDTMHFFGFECDNSVIVGFREHGYQSYIFPSNYSPN